MANQTQTKAKAATKAAPKAAPTASRIVSTNDAARAKAQAANLPTTNLQASAKVNAAKNAAKTAAPSETAAKPQAKTAAPSGTANIVAMIVEGIAKRIEAKSPYYATALAYHARNKTAFPRARNNETRAALKAEDVAQVFEMHDKKILASGNAKGQAMFDVYMMQRT